MLRLACLGAVLVAVSACGDDEPRARGHGRDSGAASEDAEVSDAQSASGSPAAKGDLYVSGDGADDASGSKDEPMSLPAALERLTPGHTIYLRGGTYRLSETLRLAAHGGDTPEKVKTLSQYQREAPLLDFSGAPSDGVRIEGDRWRVVGLIVRGAPRAGIAVTGSHVTVERCAMLDNGRAGLQLGATDSGSKSTGWPSDVAIVDCESFDNHAATGSSDQADGFSVAFAVGGGNVFRGCVSHHNWGDGWDLGNDSGDAAANPVTIDQCVAHTNGTLTDGTRAAGSAAISSGFKLGSADFAVAHTITRSIAYYNDAHGFSSGGNTGAVRLINTLAFENTMGNYVLGDAAVFTNAVSVWVQTAIARDDQVARTSAGGSNRLWIGGSEHVAATEFASALQGPKLTRSMEGALDFSAFSLRPDSALVDAGELPEGPLPFPSSYYQGNPDLGAVESQ